METISGKQNIFLDAAALRQKTVAYNQAWIDLGTGDGRYVIDTARRNPAIFVIGIDACRENLVRASRSAPANALFVIANAMALPVELRSLAGHLTINFPWGSLLEALLRPDPALLDGLRACTKPMAGLEVRLNASALLEAGWELEAGGRQVKAVLESAGFRVKPITHLDSAGLKSCPSTWARKLAFGRKPSALVLRAACE